MTKWYTVSGRFTEEEKKLMDKWQKTAELSDNQMVRGGVAIMLGFMSMAEVMFRPDFAPLQGYVKEVNKMMTSPKYQKDMEKVFEKWSSGYKADQIKEFESKLREVQDELKVFEKHQKRGRQSTKQKRTKSKRY